MAESAASSKLTKLRAQRQEAMKRSAGGAREDAAIKKAVDSPAPASEDKQESTPQPQRRPMGRTKIPISGGGQHAVYQRHVLFAIVTAFLIKLASAGKTSLTK
jgi:hypothetical protein